MKKVTLVLPAYNEQDNILPMIEELEKCLPTLSGKYLFEYVFVDDGSTDQTSWVLEQASQKYPHVFYIRLSRNFGHQGALLAGLHFAKGDAIISMDCDLQHPPSLIPQMLAAWEDGNDVVYTLRKNDQKLSFFKRKTSSLFYQIVNVLSDVKIESGAADFRLVDRKVLDTILKFNDHDLFLRGTISWVGYTSKSIEFTPNERFSGKTKYTFRKMLNLAIKGITSQSTKPLYFSVFIGLIFALLSFGYLPYVIYSFLADHASAGWSSLLLSIAFFGSLQLIVLGVIGIYIGKIFTQVKNRPAFIVSQTNIK